MSKRNSFLVGTIVAAIGVILLGVDRLFVSANDTADIASIFSIYTIIALVLLAAVAIWFYIISFRKDD